MTVLTGETGSGKTTCVPLFVLERYAAAARGAEANVLVAQPRRVAAVSVARRVAEVFGEPVGSTVGYAVRGDSRVCPRRTRLTFLTTGALLRRLAADPELRGVSHVFVDEIHERTADADFLLAHLRDLLVKRWFSPKSGAEGRTATDSDRNEPISKNQSEGASPPRATPLTTPLRVVLMSATMASSDLRDYFGSRPRSRRRTSRDARSRSRSGSRMRTLWRPRRTDRKRAKNAKTKTRRIVPTTRSTRTRARWSRRSLRFWPSWKTSHLHPAHQHRALQARAWCSCPAHPRSRGSNKRSAPRSRARFRRDCTSCPSTGSSRARSSVARSTRRRSA